MATIKMTKKMVLEGMVKALDPETPETLTEDLTAAFIDYAKNELFLIAKKALTAKTTQTKAQKENIPIKEAILNVLADQVKPVTVTDMLKDKRLEGLSNQKVSSLLSKMIKEGTVVKEIVKKVSLFALAEAKPDDQTDAETEPDEVTEG